MNDFSSARVGDKVWDFIEGWGQVYDVLRENKFPIRVSFIHGNEKATEYYTYEGVQTDYNVRSLFWDELKYEMPERPLRLERKSAWVNVYKGTSLRFLGESLFPSEELAIKGRDNDIGIDATYVATSRIEWGEYE